MDKILACKDRKEAFQTGELHVWRLLVHRGLENNVCSKLVEAQSISKGEVKKKVGKRGEGKFIIE